MTTDLSLLTPEQLLQAALMMQQTLESFVQSEPCDCGCPTQSSVKLFRPTVYYASALDTLVCIERLAGE